VVKEELWSRAWRSRRPAWKRVRIGSEMYRIVCREGGAIYAILQQQEEKETVVMRGKPLPVRVQLFNFGDRDLGIDGYKVVGDRGELFSLYHDVDMGRLRVVHYREEEIPQQIRYYALKYRYCVKRGWFGDWLGYAPVEDIMKQRVLSL